MKYLKLFEHVTFTAKPKVIKASLKSDIAIIWFDIWVQSKVTDKSLF